MEAPSPHSTTDRTDAYEASDESANLSGDTMNILQVGDKVQIKDRLGTILKIIEVDNGKSYIVEVEKEGTELFSETTKIRPVSIKDSVYLS